MGHQGRVRWGATANVALTTIYRLPLAIAYAGRCLGGSVRTTVESLLVVRGDGGIGDFVLFLPALAALRRHYSKATITLLVGSESAKIASAFAGVDEVISFNVRKYRLNFAYRVGLIRRLRARRYDLALNPIYSREPLTDELLYCSGARETVVFDGNLDNIPAWTKAANNGYFTRIISSRTGRVSEVDRNREFFEKLTNTRLTAEQTLPRIVLPEAEIQKARLRLLAEGIDPDVSPPIVLFPGASNEIKQWPAGRFAELANRVAARFKSPLIICGGPSDVEAQEAVGSKITSPAVRLAGKTDLVELIAILKLSALYIGNDTGPLHLAAAVGTPTLCILGGGHFGRFYPYGDPQKTRAVFHELECFHCNWVCPYEVSRCIDEISVDQAWITAQQMLSQILVSPTDRQILKLTTSGAT